MADVIDIKLGAILVGWFLFLLVLVVLIVRYSNKKIMKKFAALDKKLKKIEKLAEKAEKDGVSEKRQLLKKIQSLERELRKSIE